MKFLARLFPYTRRLEKKFYRTRRRAVSADYVTYAKTQTTLLLGELLEAADDRTAHFGKITLKEVEEIMTAIVDYHDAMVSLATADPIRARVYPIFEKYGIKVENAAFWNPDQLRSSWPNWKPVISVTS